MTFVTFMTFMTFYVARQSAKKSGEKTWWFGLITVNLQL